MDQRWGLLGAGCWPQRAAATHTARPPARRNPNTQCRKPKRVNVEALQFHFHDEHTRLPAPLAAGFAMHGRGCRPALGGGLLPLPPTPSRPLAPRSHV